MPFCRAVVVFVVLLLAPAAAAAAEFGLNIYGLSYHFERERARAIGADNEFNPGIGVRYQIGENERFRWFADAGVYRDSGRNTAKVAGGAFEWKATQSLGMGAALVVFHSDTYNRGRVGIAPLPLVSYELKAASLNLVYIPKINELNDINTLGFWVTLWPGRW